MTAGPVGTQVVAQGLGWPSAVVPDPVIGWPRVPRETLLWTVSTVSTVSTVKAVDLVDRTDAREPAVQQQPGLNGEAARPPVSDAPDLPTIKPAEPAEPAEQAVPAVASAPDGSPPEVPEALEVTNVSFDTLSESAITRPPGPRRARFDVAEEGLPPASEPPGLDVSRGTRVPATLPRPSQPRVFVVANQKGGVGKTTTSVNLAAALALGGLSVLVVDLDPQGNASTALGVDHSPGTPGTYEVLIGGAALADHLVASTEAPGLMVLPASIDLAAAEIELVSVVARENRLLRALRTYLVAHPVDYVFIDCPPSLGLLTLNALVAATEILIPIQCEYYALEGVSQLVRTIQLVTGELNPELRLSTVLLTMFDARTRLAAQVAAEVREYFPAETLPTVIPRSVRISEAPSYGQTVLTYHPDSAGSVSYLQAAQEIARRGAASMHEENA